MKGPAQLLRALTDATRIRILLLLQDHEDLCVCEIVDALRLPQYSVSRHLGVLKAAGLVADRRQGRWMHYVLAPTLSREDRAVVIAVCARAAREPAASQDQRRLEQHLRPRVKGKVVRCEA